MTYTKSIDDCIIALKNEGKSSRAIAGLLGISKSGVNERYNRIVVSKQKELQDNSRILLISDMHIPYHHKDSFEFLGYLKDKYNPTRVISLGDECFPPEVEILTDKGFVRFDNLQDENIGQWGESGEISFVKPERKVIKEFNGELLQFKHKTMTVRCTPKHMLVKISPLTGKIHRREAWDTVGTDAWEIPRVGTHDGSGISLKDDEIRLMVAFQADGAFTKGAARFAFTKKRKITRLLELLKSCDIPYNTHTVEREDYQQFYIEKRNVPEYFTKHFSIPAQDYTLHQRKVFLDELGHWDGCFTSCGMRYSSAVHENVEYVQWMATISGVYSSKIKREGNCKRIDLVWNKEKSSFKSAVKSYIPYNGKVYCVTVPSGMIVVRIDGYVIVTGNCDNHSLSYHDSDPELYSAGHELAVARKHIKHLERMFPTMDILESNHGSLAYRKAKTHGFPKHYIKSYNDVLGVGEGWKWYDELTIDLPNGQQCYFHHGKTSDVLKLSQTMGMNAVQGHYHTDFGVRYWANPNGLFWGLQIGCLVDNKSLAFAYNKLNLKKPIIGTAVIINGIPTLEPMLLDKQGRWIKHSRVS